MFIMGTITINVDDDTESRFRQAVLSEYGKGKGVLGKAVTEAINGWVADRRCQDISERQLRMLKSGFDMKHAASNFRRMKFYDEVTRKRAGS
jgi:hypothetical protein